MSVSEIIQNIKALAPAELDDLYAKLDEIWDARFREELEAAREEVKRRGLTEADVDRFIARRRGRAE